jgi:hypothetical protein
LKIKAITPIVFALLIPSVFLAITIHDVWKNWQGSIVLFMSMLLVGTGTAASVIALLSAISKTSDRAISYFAPGRGLVTALAVEHPARNTRNADDCRSPGDVMGLGVLHDPIVDDACMQVYCETDFRGLSRLAERAGAWLGPQQYAPADADTSR